MNRTSLRNLGVLAGVSLALTMATSAAAQPAQVKLSPVVFNLQTGLNAGPQETDGGPGSEQADVSYVVKGDDVYVVSIYMSSKVSENNWQCKCSSVKLSPSGAPTVMADQVQLTNYVNGDRACNHPSMATMEGSNRIAWLFGSDEDSNNTETYVSVIDESCNMLMEPKQVSTTNGNNNGAPDIAYSGNGYFTGGYLSTNNNDTSYAMGLELIDLGGDQVDVERTYLKGVVAPSNIGRPSIARIDDQYSLFCAAQGNNRPPEDGVACAVVDNMNGTVMYKQIIAASQPGQKKYMNQPTVARLDNGMFAVRVLESSGEGKTNNKKGSNLSHDYIISPQGENFLTVAHEMNLGSYATHSTICSGAYGLSGKTAFGVYGSAITGNSQPVVRFFSLDNSQIKADSEHNAWVAGWYGDSGKLANMYGHNPGTQGRDFLRCLGDIPNPAFGKNVDGFYPSVKTFFAVPHAGRVPGEEKNSGWLTLIPGHTTVEAIPAEPADPKDVELGTQGEKPTESEPPVTGEDPPTPEDPGGSDPQITVNNGGSCSASGTGSSTGALAMMVGLALALSSRRRKVA